MPCWLKRVPHVCARLRPRLAEVHATDGQTHQLGPGEAPGTTFCWFGCPTHISTNTSSNLLLPSVGPDNLRPEAGLEDWRGEMGSGVSDWVAPGLASGTTSPGLHSSPPGFSPYLPLHSTNLQSLRTKSRRLPFLAFHFTSGRLELLVSYPWALGPGPPQERHLQMSL